MTVNLQGWPEQLLVIITLVIVIKYVWKRRKLYLLSWKLPGPFAPPLLGNSLTFLCKNDELLDRTLNIVSGYSSPIRFWLGPKFILIFKNVQQVEKILCSMKFAHKDDDLYRFLKVYNGEGLISGSGPKWKRDRRHIYPLFFKAKIELYAPSFVEHSKILVGVLKNHINQSCFNVESLLHRCSTDIVNETILGSKTTAQQGSLDSLINYIVRSYQLVHARIMKVWLQIEWIFRFTHYWKEQEETKQFIHGFLQSILNDARKNRGNVDTFARSVIDQMLDINDDLPDFATDLEFIHQLSTLMSASGDTITVICSFTLLLLGMYPEIQNKIVDEISHVIGRGGQNVRVEDISRLVYLDMCVKDVLRLFPIAPFIMRVASEDFEIGGCEFSDKLTIPKGCSIMVAIHNIHRDAKHWERPDSFYPEHFLPDKVRDRHPYAFLPFSAGPRGCLGKFYAYLAIKTILVTFLQNYVVEADGKIEDIKLVTDISVRIKDSLYPIRIKARLGQ